MSRKNEKPTPNFCKGKLLTSSDIVEILMEDLLFDNADFTDIEDSDDEEDNNVSMSANCSNFDAVFENEIINNAKHPENEDSESDVTEDNIESIPSTSRQLPDQNINRKWKKKEAPTIIPDYRLRVGT